MYITWICRFDAIMTFSLYSVLIGVSFDIYTAWIWTSVEIWERFQQYWPLVTGIHTETKLSLSKWQPSVLPAIKMTTFTFSVAVISSNKGPEMRSCDLFIVVGLVHKQCVGIWDAMRNMWRHCNGFPWDVPLQWRHNGCDGVSNHRRIDCLLNPMSRRRSKKTSMLRVTGLCEGTSPVTGEFPA